MEGTPPHRPRAIATFGAMNTAQQQSGLFSFPLCTKQSISLCRPHSGTAKWWVRRVNVEGGRPCLKPRQMPPESS